MSIKHRVHTLERKTGPEFLMVFPIYRDWHGKDESRPRLDDDQVGSIAFYGGGDTLIVEREPQEGFEALEERAREAAEERFGVPVNVLRGFHVV